MSIEKEYGKYTPMCDGCLTTLEPCDTFQDAIDECKENNWCNVLVFGTWENRCPKCQDGKRATQYKPKFLDW